MARIGRREFIGTCAAGAASFGLSMSAGLGAADRPRPNVIFILTDDLGYGDIGCYNIESRIRTPNVDGLAASGIRFTDAHSPRSGMKNTAATNPPHIWRTIWAGRTGARPCKA